MIPAKIPENESERLRKLYELDILDSLEDPAYDDLTKLAAEICNTPIALISLIDQNRQWFKSHHGLAARETPRDFAFCSHAILEDEIFVVEDADKDPRFHDNPLNVNEPHVKFYAGAPLTMSNNIRLGTLCVIGNQPRTISNAQKEALAALARQVVSQLELRLKVKELELLDNAKDEFISMVSHELRTPLTAIYGSLSLLHHKKIGVLDAQQQDIVDISFRNSKRLLELVNDILILSKLESGDLEMNIGVIDLKEFLKKSVQLNQPYCKTCNTTLVLKYPQSINSLTIYGDESRLLQVISNFISNAAKFTREKDVIEISAEQQADQVMVSVTDHGSGIAENQKDLIFKKFKQLKNNDNNKLPGTGLGLNISKKLIELQNGTVGFKSTPNVATTFYFKLPIAP